MKNHLYYIALTNLFLSCNNNDNSIIKFIPQNFNTKILNNLDTINIIPDNQCINCIDFKKYISKNNILITNISKDYLKNLPIQNVMFTNNDKLIALNEVQYKNTRLIIKNDVILFIEHF
jgi:hypothetical protein